MQCVALARPEVRRCHERGALACCQAGNFYKVKYEHNIKRDVVGGVHACFNSTQLNSSLLKMVAEWLKEYST